MPNYDNGPTKTPPAQWANKNTFNIMGQPKHPQHSGPTKTPPAQWANQNRCETISSLLIPGDLFRRPPFSFNSVRIIYVCILIYCILYTQTSHSHPIPYINHRTRVGAKKIKIISRKLIFVLRKCDNASNSRWKKFNFKKFFARIFSSILHKLPQLVKEIYYM